MLMQGKQSLMIISKGMPQHGDRICGLYLNRDASQSVSGSSRSIAYALRLYPGVGRSLSTLAVVPR